MNINFQIATKCATVSRFKFFSWIKRVLRNFIHWNGRCIPQNWSKWSGFGPVERFVPSRVRTASFPFFSPSYFGPLFWPNNILLLPISAHGNGNQAPGEEDARKMYVPFDTKKKTERKMYVPCKFSIFFLFLFFHYNRGSKSLLLEE